MAEQLKGKFSAESASSLRSFATQINDRLKKLGLGNVDDDAVVYALLATVACGIVLLAFFVYRWITARADRRDAVILVGTSGEQEKPGPGKTMLFKVLKTGNPPKYGVVSSVEPREARVQLKSGLEVRVVDFPGAPTLRNRLSSYLDTAKIVVYVLDSVAFSQEAQKDADLLYDVLTHKEVSKRRTPVLVFCNKADLMGSTSIELIKIELEKELEQLRKSKDSALGDIGGEHFDDDEKPSLGVEGEPFCFEHASSLVRFAAGSASKANIGAVTKFIAKHFATT